MKHKFEGLIVPLLTPMHEDTTIDKFGFKNLVASLMNKGIKNFFVLSDFGESFFCDNEKQRNIIDLSKKEIFSKANLLVGCFSNSVDGIIEKILFAQKYADFCVVNLPFDALTNEIAFIDFFDKLFTKTSAEIILYNNPFIFKRNIPIAGINKIAGWEKLIGIIDCSKNMTYFRALSDYHQLLKIFQGFEELFYESKNYYCSGVISVTSNVFPQLFDEKENITDIRLLAKKELQINQLFSIIPRDKKIQSIKFLLSLKGIIQEYYSRQLPQLTQQEKDALLVLLKNSEQENIFIKR